MREDLLRRWLTSNPEGYDRMVDQDPMAAYLATINGRLLAFGSGGIFLQDKAAGG
jgi:hypothetical protein